MKTYEEVEVYVHTYLTSALTGMSGKLYKLTTPRA
jgi:hypothetical protein